MKNRIVSFILIYLLSACQTKNKNENSLEEIKEDTFSTTIATYEKNEKKEVFWKGYINQSIPIFLHYQIEDNIVVGEILYLNTKEKKPIKIIGNLLEDDNFRLLEFDSSGNITGIITATVSSENRFVGEWFSPKSRKNYPLDLTIKDTTVVIPEIKVKDKKIFGTYRYAYSEAGSQGEFSIEKINEKQVAFEIFSVTSDPARNIASVEKDTINLINNSFIYNIPDSDDCEFKVNFYKGFVSIHYTKGFCSGQFGHNATIEGVFLKIN
ncbi:conserved hypothetical protein [Flavobacterium sp. 9AF]|uniref:hypothetical protein n=1 Tax=Flavobacterium sp. 9AF TaxID=2653142 RepID=UPI0012F2DE33|nr:hypothetical protein [Flavobacterium sp. 9AF]VXB71319.1 conserved hypothetical protein [Flavobacterium sp. 9AF]